MEPEKQRVKKVMPVSPGRPKGIPNKTTQTAKDAIAKAADALGGADRLVEWAKEEPQNEKAFWTVIYPKLLPLQVQGDKDNPIAINIIKRIIVDSPDN